MYPANEEIYSACSIPLRFIRMRTRSQASNKKMSRYDGFGCSVDKTRVCFFFLFFLFFYLVFFLRLVFPILSISQNTLSPFFSLCF